MGIIQVPINSLILVPKASTEECAKLYSNWMKEIFKKNVKIIETK